MQAPGHVICDDVDMKSNTLMFILSVVFLHPLFRYSTLLCSLSRSSMLNMFDFNMIGVQFSITSALPTFLSPNARYERVMEAFGGRGYFADTAEKLDAALGKCFQNSSEGRASLVNVIIDTTSQKKKQDFDWLTRSKM